LAQPPNNQAIGITPCCLSVNSSSCHEVRQQIQVKIFWIMMPCSFVVEYQHFRDPCCLHLQDKVAGMCENGTDTGLDWRGAAGDASQQEAERE